MEIWKPIAILILYQNTCNFRLRHLRFSRPWKLKSWSSGLWRHVVLW